MPADVFALFDLDHTLTPHDSDEQWVAFLVKQGALDAVRYDAANRDLTARYNAGGARVPHGLARIARCLTLPKFSLSNTS
jgi:phosphoserine phosphatase